MWSYNKRLNSDQFRIGYEYKALEPEDNIPDDIYDAIARAAEILYADTQKIETSLEMQRLALIDLEVETNGTETAEEMLKEIFKNKH